tara:strand:- start:198 stop:494 length:297 start_codon:yes stop_codon:yes gene_type:complete
MRSMTAPAVAQAQLDRGCGKSVAVSMDVVDKGQAHLDALHELLDRRERISKKRPARPQEEDGSSWSLGGAFRNASFEKADPARATRSSRWPLSQHRQK